MNFAAHNKKLHGLDHLRALAIVLVFLYHYCRLFPHPEWTVTLGSFGWTGVDLFFVLSGYLIASQLFSNIKHENSIALKDFYIKRFFRIVPAYAAVLIVYFNFPTFRERESLSPLWKFLTFTQNYGLDLRYYGTFSHAWSLCIEEQFYLIFPLLLLAISRFNPGKKSVFILLAVFVLGFVLRVFSWNNFVAPFVDTDEFGIQWIKWIYYPTYNRLDGLLAGVAIAGIFTFMPALKNLLTKYYIVMLFSGLVLITGAYFLCEVQSGYNASVFGFPLIALAYGLLVIAALSPKCFLYKYSSVITSKIAALSYSVYLVHKGAIHITQAYFVQLNIAEDSTLMFFIATGITLILALLLHYAIEKPFMKLRTRFLSEREVKHNL